MRNRRNGQPSLAEAGGIRDEILAAVLSDLASDIYDITLVP